MFSVLLNEGQVIVVNELLKVLLFSVVNTLALTGFPLKQILSKLSPENIVSVILTKNSGKVICFNEVQPEKILLGSSLLDIEFENYKVLENKITFKLLKF